MKFYKFYLSEEQIKALSDAIIYAELYRNKMGIKDDFHFADELGVEFAACYELIQRRKALPWYKRF